MILQYNEVNVENDNISYTEIEWRIDNDFQEVVFCDNDFAVKTLFTQMGKQLIIVVRKHMFLGLMTNNIRN